MLDVSSQRIYSWAVETAFRGAVSSDTLARAASQFRGLPKATAWLLDASATNAVSPDVLVGIDREIGGPTGLASIGLGYVAVVLPPAAMPFLPMVVEQAKRFGVVVRSFDSRISAIAWFKSGCK